MRIVTVAMPVASAPAGVYAAADVDALLAMLAHKIGQVVMQQGIEQGQGLLQDWLVLFIAAYNTHRGLQPRSPQEVGCSCTQPRPGRTRMRALMTTQLALPCSSDTPSAARFQVYAYGLQPGLDCEFQQEQLMRHSIPVSGCNNMVAQQSRTAGSIAAAAQGLGSNC